MPLLLSRLLDVAYARRVGVDLGVRHNSRQALGEFVLRDLRKHGCPRIHVGATRGRHRFQQCHVIAFAHELGHHTSWSRGLDDPEHTRIATESPGLLLQWGLSSEAAARAVLDVEARAWTFAHDELRTLGFSNWQAFERQASAAFGSYARALQGLVTF